MSRHEGSLEARDRADRDLLEANGIPTLPVIVGTVHLDGTTLTYQTIVNPGDDINQAVKVEGGYYGMRATWKTTVTDESARQHRAALDAIYSPPDPYLTGYIDGIAARHDLGRQA